MPTTEAQNQMFRIFVSSTFGDFQKEREALRQRVWPELRSHCAKHGMSFQEVDLRFGVSEQASMDHDTLRICLEEVTRCQRLSPRPNFIILGGDRYGWRPLPGEIPLKEFDGILLNVPSEQERSLLRHWYRRDENAIPASYRLLSLAEANCLPPEWGAAEPKLKALLRAAMLKQFGADSALELPLEIRNRYFISATHHEFLQGVHLNAKPAGQVFAYLRHIPGLPATQAASAFCDLASDDVTVDPEPQALLAQMHNEIECKLPANQRREYECVWTDTAEQTIGADYLEQLCADVEQDLMQVIDEESARITEAREAMAPLAREAKLHADFATERARCFVGRSAMQQQIVDHVHGVLSALPEDVGRADCKSLILHGPGGCGKSALMAQLAESLATRQPAELESAVILSRFIGATPRSVDPHSFLIDLLQDIARAYDKESDTAKLTALDMVGLGLELHKNLDFASPKKPLVVLVDAVDQFVGDPATALAWLPYLLPAYVVIVVSVLDGPVEQLLHQQLCGAPALRMPVFTADEGEEMLNALLAVEDQHHPARRLAAVQQQAVLTAFSEECLPLYLTIAGALARRWPSWLDAASPHLPASLSGLVNHYLEQIERSHGRGLVSRALGYIGRSRYGLSESELQQILWHDPAVQGWLDAHQSRTNQPKPDRGLPPIIWSRLYFDLEPFLVQRSWDGEELLAFFHRQFGVEVLARYADNEELHGVLADYFSDNSLQPLSDATTGLTNARRVTELPWQLCQAERLPELSALLCDFNFAMAACSLNRADALYDEHKALTDVAARMEAALPTSCQAWQKFLRLHQHVLRRGNAAWPAHKILLQLAIEHFDDCPVTGAAEDFLSQGKCDWAWLRRERRPARMGSDPCLSVMEGHTGWMLDALVLDDGRVLSWSQDGTLRLWRDDKCLRVLEGHKEWVNDAKCLPDGRILSCSMDGTLRLWSNNGYPLKVLEGHAEDVEGFLVFPDGRILSWSSDNTLRFWQSDGEQSQELDKSHTKGVAGAILISDDSFLTWSKKGELSLWNNDGSHCTAMPGHEDGVNGAKVLSDGRLLSWSRDATLRLWDASGTFIKVLAKHSKLVKGAMQLKDGRILSWSGDATLRLWSQGGGELAELKHHTGSVEDACELADGRLLSWSGDSTLILWSPEGEFLRQLVGHSDHVSGAFQLPDSRIVSWSTDYTLFIWSSEGERVSELRGHAGVVQGAKLHSGSLVVSWSEDMSLRLWDTHVATDMERMAGHRQAVLGTRNLSDGRILSWSKDGALRLWAKDGAPLAELKEHQDRINSVDVLANGHILSRSTYAVNLSHGDGTHLGTLEEGGKGIRIGAYPLADDRILSWSSTHGLRLWSADGEFLGAMPGHEKKVNGAAQFADGRILTYADDATLRIWSDMGSPLVMLSGHEKAVNNAQILSDGTVLSASSDGTVRLWRDDGHCLSVMQGSQFRVLADSRILTGSNAGKTYLGHPGGELQAEFDMGSQWVSNVRSLPDGRILWWSAYRSLHLWDEHSQQVTSHPWHQLMELEAVIWQTILPEVQKANGAVLAEPLQYRVTLGGLKVPDLHWHSKVVSYARHLFPDGRAVVSLDDGQLCFLQVYRGSSRVAIDEILPS